MNEKEGGREGGREGEKRGAGMAKKRRAYCHRSRAVSWSS